MRQPVVMLAGGSSASDAASIAGYAAAVVDAFDGFDGTIVSGGTTVGVSAVAGDVGARYQGRISVLGYVPGVVPSDVDVDEDRRRYSELRRTAGSRFSVLEPLQAWRDVLAGGVCASSVKMLGIGGGTISCTEYQLALAVGACCGLIRGSGGSADRMLGDDRFAHDVVALTPDAEAIRRFLRR